MALLQFMNAGKDKVAVPASVHCGDARDQGRGGRAMCPIVITGDDAEALAALVGHSLTVDDALTLRGLAELYHINQKPRRV
mgnify:CR=1 FL=1